MDRAQRASAPSQPGSHSVFACCLHRWRPGAAHSTPLEEETTRRKDAGHTLYMPEAQPRINRPPPGLSQKEKSRLPGRSGGGGLAVTESSCKSCMFSWGEGLTPHLRCLSARHSVHFSSQNKQLQEPPQALPPHRPFSFFPWPASC